MVFVKKRMKAPKKTGVYNFFGCNLRKYVV